MKIRIGDSLLSFDLNIEPDQLFKPLDDKTNKQLQELIDERDIKCSGCGKSLKNRRWISVFRRDREEDVITRKTKIGELNALIKDTKRKENWSVFFFCDADCFKGWKEKRKDRFK
jgi:hypothetical protein